MKNVKKFFAVRIWFGFDFVYTTVVCAPNEKQAINIGINEGRYKYKFESDNEDNKVFSTKAKLLPTCVLKSTFGNINLDIRPNPYYDDEIIINDTRITLPNEFNYWDVDSIIIHDTGFPVIATIRAKERTFIVQNDIMGNGKRFEIIK